MNNNIAFSYIPNHSLQFILKVKNKRRTCVSTDWKTYFSNVCMFISIAWYFPSAPVQYHRSRQCIMQLIIIIFDSDIISDFSAKIIFQIISLQSIILYSMHELLNSLCIQNFINRQCLQSFNCFRSNVIVFCYPTIYTYHSILFFHSSSFDS